MANVRNNLIKGLMQEGQRRQETGRGNERPIGRFPKRIWDGKTISKGRKGADDMVNDQYDAADVTGTVPTSFQERAGLAPTVDNSFLGDHPVKPKFDAREYEEDRSPQAFARRREDKNARDKYEKEKQEWDDRTDAWEAAEEDRTGVNGKFRSFEAKRRNAEAARSIFKDDLKKPLTKETYDGLSDEKKLLLTRMLDQKLADETGSLPKWVKDGDRKYYSGQAYSGKSWDEKLSEKPSYGNGLRNGKRK